MTNMEVTMGIILYIGIGVLSGFIYGMAKEELEKAFAVAVFWPLVFLSWVLKGIVYLIRDGV